MHDLDAGAPELKSGEYHRMNRRALGFLLAMVLLLGLAAIWMLGNVLRPEKKEKPSEELVTVPTAPPLPSPAPAPPPAPQAEAIPLELPALPPAPPPPAAPSAPTLAERRMASGPGTVGVSSVNAGHEEAAMQAPSPQTATGGMPGGPGWPGFPGMPTAADAAIPPNSAYRGKPLPATSNAAPLRHADALMLRGTYIRCVLETHIVTDVPGFTSCSVTEPIYSVNGRHLLLPKGSRVLGKYDTEPNGTRVAVIWDRVVTPNGIDVTMASPGVDNLGGAGHPGHLDEHWVRRISSAMLISLFADAFKYGAAKNGPPSTTLANGPFGASTQSPYESYTAQTLQGLAAQAAQRSANQPSTVAINQGTVVNVYVARDVDFTGVLARPAS